MRRVRKVENAERKQGVGFLNVLLSTLAAAFGVQSRANRERDFEHGSPGVFIAAGVIFTVLFVVLLVVVVNLVTG